MRLNHFIYIKIYIHFVHEFVVQSFVEHFDSAQHLKSFFPFFFHSRLFNLNIFLPSFSLSSFLCFPWCFTSIVSTLNSSLIVKCCRKKKLLSLFESLVALDLKWNAVHWRREKCLKWGSRELFGITWNWIRCEGSRKRCEVYRLNYIIKGNIRNRNFSLAIPPRVMLCLMCQHTLKFMKISSPVLSLRW